MADRRTTKYYLFFYYTVHKVRLIIVIEKICRLFIYPYSHGRVQKRGSSREVYSCHTAFPLRLVNSGSSPETIENNLRIVLTENTIERQGIRWQHCNFSDWKLAFFLPFIHITWSKIEGEANFQEQGIVFLPLQNERKPYFLHFNCIYMSGKKTLPSKNLLRNICVISYITLR